jgi:ribosome-binding protein aMBF1 (putative translation factor)
MTQAKPEQVVDFEAVMLELRRHGFSQRSIAHQVKAPESTVKSYAYGTTSPTFDVGERLISFWCATTNRTREELPRTSSMSPARRIRVW